MASPVWPDGRGGPGPSAPPASSSSSATARWPSPGSTFTSRGS